MRVRVLLFSFFTISIFLFGIPVQVLAYDAQTGDIPGIVTGIGTHFQIVGSDYLNVSLDSTESLKMRLMSMRGVLTMRVQSAGGLATSTDITITGLMASTTYYIYEDNLHNLTQVVSDDVGVYSYTQDISEPHTVFIQTRHSTKFITNDATGGDCASFGTWDAGTLTCTLTSDVSETIEIDSDSVTLDGAGHTMDGGQSVDMGVYIDTKNGIIVKNLTIKDFSFGVFLNASSHITVADTVISDDGITSFDSSEDTFTGDTFSGSGRAFTSFNSSGDTMRDDQISGSADAEGVFLFTSTGGTIASSTFFGLGRALFLYDGSNDTTISGNTFTDSGDALFLYDSAENAITNNTISGANQALFLFNSHDNTIANNTFSSSTEALFVYESSYGNTMYHNNFLRNGTNVMDYSGMNNAFSLPKPAGGNYFDSFDDSSEGCDDVDADGICDAPYVFAQDHDAGRDVLPWTMQNGWGDAPIAHISNHSSVLFLPGIEGSRLYEGTGIDCGAPADEKLWEPYESLWKAIWGAGDAKVKNLFLDQDGASVCPDIYTKVDDVIDSVHDSNLYKSFIDEMDGLKSDQIIADWKPVAYDWRLSLDDLLSRGVEHDGKIYYGESTNTPYIEQTLRALAKNSKTGKVTIVAHSNGGLVAKALLDKLENQLGGSVAKLVDKVIMVGVPQNGAPADVGSLLVGYGAGLYSDVGAFKSAITIVSNQAARAFSQNSSMAYHLLPSQSYFDSVMDDPAHPVARFAGDAYAKEISAYGPVIGTLTELDDFLLAKNGEREKPAENNLGEAEILNSGLIEYANNVHDTLDGWTPPASIEVDQIAGWGVDTVAGIDFYTQDATDAVSALVPTRLYRQITVEDGDGTVPVPSALMMASSTNVKRYWVNLFSYNYDLHSSRAHGDIFEIPSLRDLIKNIITNSTSTLPTYISSTQPPVNNGNKKLTFYLHSPLTLEIMDSSGHSTGLAPDDSIMQDIPGSTYGEFGEVKYISVPLGGSYALTMHGQSRGTFSLDIQESSGGVVTALSTIANVPTTASTLASLTISDGLDTVSALTVDENGDGKNVATIIPKIGETVNYEPPAPIPAPQARSTGSGGRHISIPSIVPVLVATTTSTSSPQAIAVAPATITQPVGIHTPVLATTKPLQAKKKASVPIVPSEKVNTNVSQTASAYEASKQSVLQKLGAIVYNGLQGFWNALKKFF